MRDGESARGLTIVIGGKGGARWLRFRDGRAQGFFGGREVAGERGLDEGRERGKRSAGPGSGQGGGVE